MVDCDNEIVDVVADVETKVEVTVAVVVTPCVELDPDKLES